MKLYAWQPAGHGEYSIFVCAETEAQARGAVEHEMARLVSLGRASRLDFEGWGTDHYELIVAEPGQVVLNENP